MRFGIRATVFALVALAFGSVGIGGQEPIDSESSSTQAAPPVFGETINVRVIEIEVFVEDKKGNPVTGLTIDDFTILENKRPVKITNFYEYEDGLEVGVEAEAVAEEREPAKPRSREDLFTSHPRLRTSKVPEDQRLSLVVYVDEFNITPYDRNRLFRSLRQFLRTKLDRDDRVMLVTYNRSLKVVRPFTSDPGLIADATYDLEKNTGGRTLTIAERKGIITAMAREESDYNQILARVRMHAQSVFNDLQFTLDGIKSAVEQMAGIPGRKALLYLSNGLPMRSAEDLFWAVDERFREGDTTGGTLARGQSTITSNPVMEAFQYDASRRFDELASMANANRVTLYTIDAAGLRVGGMRSAEYADTTFLSTNIDSLYQHNMQDSLAYLAYRTGGRAIINTNNHLGGLNKIANDFDYRYSLGYSPSHTGTGRQYKIHIELSRELRKKGYKPRYRDTYRDKPVEQEMGDATLAALTFNYQSNPMGVKFSLDEGPDGQVRRDDGNYLVSFEVRIPIDSLVLIPAGEAHEARLRVFVQAIDDEGKISTVGVNPVRVYIKPGELEQARGKYYVYELKLLMERGEQRVAIAVRDDMSGRSSVLTRFVGVGS